MVIIMSFEVEIVREYLNSLDKKRKEELFKELLQTLSEKEKAELLAALMPLILDELSKLPETTKKKLIKVLE